MKQLSIEIESAFARFGPEIDSQIQQSITQLGKSNAEFLTSYKRLVSLQAWRSELLESVIPEGALEFFLEAQNDAVLSHVLARMGCWRSSLQSLRSVIENVYHSIYYKDHPVELVLWEQHDHKLDRVDLEKYLQKHPALADVAPNLNGLRLLNPAFTVLNNAVHGSARGFRMTSNVSEPRICSSDKARLGKWLTNERDVIVGVNLLLIAIFRNHIAGAARPNLRKAIGLSLPKPLAVQVKNELKVTIPTL